MVPPLLDEDSIIIREYIFLPLIKMALERDRKVINITNTKFKQQYIEIINEGIHRVTKDMRKNKDAIFDHQIHMTKITWLSYQVHVNGYVHEVSYHKTVAADWINERVKEYIPTL